MEPNAIDLQTHAVHHSGARKGANSRRNVIDLVSTIAIHIGRTNVDGAKIVPTRRRAASTTLVVGGRSVGRRVVGEGEARRGGLGTCVDVAADVGVRDSGRSTGAWRSARS